MTNDPDRDDAERLALDALVESTRPPEEQVLAAVRKGLESVPTGSPTAWYVVPRQRAPRGSSNLSARRDGDG
jgi:hypothetical protein